MSALDGTIALGPVRLLGVASTSTSTKKSGGRSFASSAFLLGGSTPNLSQGLYNALGTFANPARGSATARALVPPSPAQKERAETLMAAVRKIDSGNIKGGRADAERLLDRNASDITALRLVGVSYLTERNYKQAEVYYSRASALAPENLALRDDVAIARTLQESDSEVLAEGRRLISSPTKRGTGLRLLGHLSNRTPQDANVYLALAEGFDAARKPAAVIGALQEALKVADSNQLTEVITQARELAKKNPQIGLPRNILGRALQKADRFNEAITELKAASDITPSNGSYVDDLAGAYAARAVSKLSRGDVTSAQSDISSAQSIAPLNTNVREASGRLAAKLAKKDLDARRYTRVLGFLLTASSRGPNEEAFRKELSAQFIRAGAYYQTQNNKSLAITAYSEAYKLDPDSKLARQRLAKVSYDKGIESLNSNDLDNAVTHLQRAYDTYRATEDYGKDLARAYDLRGQRYDQAGDLKKAIADFKAGYRIDPTNTALSTSLSDALRKELGI